MNYIQVYEDALAKTNSAVEAAQAVADAFDAEEELKAEEEAREMREDS